MDDTQKPTPQIYALQLNDRQQILADKDTGLPVCVKLHVRQSESTPTRLKAVLHLPTFQDGEELNGPVRPLPFARAIVGKGWTPEFRLEMN